VSVQMIIILKIFPLGNLGAWLVCCMVTVQCKLKGMSAIFMARLSKNTMNIVGKNVVVHIYAHISF
jgi:hypothetical protein